MYTAFYGLREKPFALSPDPRFLYLAESHREALAHLLYGIEQGEGFIAVTGEVGTGKTTLCRALLRRLGTEVEVAFLFNPKLTAQELLESMHLELGIQGERGTVRELVEGLNRFLLAKRAEGKRVLLIVDEAQGLSPETLEQIRLLSNLETESEKLIQILLLGQPELDAMLASPSLRQLRQRIGVRWRLVPLAPRETREYVRHRLQVAAGEERDLLTEPALREVHRRSGGVPRLVNLLCDRALLAGYADGTERIGPDLVRRADRELRGEARRRARALRRAAPVAALLVAFVAVGLGVAALWGRFAASEPEPARVAALPPAPVSEVPVPEPVSFESAAAGVADAEPGAPEDGGAKDGTAEAMTPGVADAALEAEADAPVPEVPTEPAAPRFVSDLPRALASRPPGATTADAVNALLEAWGAEPATGEIFSFAEALGQISARGFAVLTLPRANLAFLRILDHPSLLRLESRDGVPRVVALRRLGPERAWLAGVTGPEPVEVSLEQLRASWRGETYVIWRDFEGIPEVLRWGARGEQVKWLQDALADLGLLSPPPSGVFDDVTYYAVQNFQRRRQLTTDGRVGPLTKIALYEALDRYAVPRLTESGESG